MKQLLAIILSLVFILSLAACSGKTEPSASNEPAESSPAEDAQAQAADESSDKSKLVSKAGDTANCGSYDGKPVEWLCLAVDGEKALLITKDCIRLDVWNMPTESGEQAVWADCSLRAWLNGEFYNGFSAEEQAIILETELTANDNMGFNDYPEENVEWKTVTDKVFILSGDEIHRYFADGAARTALLALSEGEMAAAFDRYLADFGYVDEDGTMKNDLFALNGQPAEYWLRSNGRGYMAQGVWADGSFDDYGSNQDAGFKGVRPAVWINIG